MKIRIILIAFLALCIVPQSGCKVRKHYKEQVRLNASLERQRDSVYVSLKDSMSVLTKVREKLSESVRNYNKLLTEKTNEHINIEKRTTTQPVTVNGKTYKTAITGNWMFDTSGIKDGKLIYFDLDNDDVRATAYYEAGQMRVELQTKDRIVNVPAEEMRITKGKSSEKESSEKVLQSEKVITKDSLEQITQVLNSDSNRVSEIENSELKSETKIESKKTSRPAWLTITIVVLVVVCAIVLGWHFGWFGKVLKFIKR